MQNRYLCSLGIVAIFLLNSCGGGSSSDTTQDDTPQLDISPNLKVEETSSYKLDSSNIYISAHTLVNSDREPFYITGYADFNSDGNQDVLIASGIFKTDEYSPIYLYYGDGNGGFTKETSFLPDNYQGMQHPRKILIGDYNNDNKMDAFIIGHGVDVEPFAGESTILLLNNGNGFDYKKFTERINFDHGASSSDFDNDGDVDIFTMGSSSSENKAMMYINEGNGSFVLTTKFLDDNIVHANGYYTSEFIDINSDGYIDLLLGGHGHEGAETRIVWGNKTGKYSFSNSTSLPTVEDFQIVVDIDAADIDNDGDKDIILNRVAGGGKYTFYDGYHIQILENQNNTTFKDITSSSISNNQELDKWYLWLHMQDLNDDGHIDLVVEDDFRPNLQWINDGTGKFVLDTSNK